MNVNDKTKEVAEKVREVYRQEDSRKKSRKIIVLDEIPDLFTKVTSIKRSIKNYSRFQKIVDYIEENYLMEVFNGDMEIYDSCIGSVKDLERLSHQYKINFGMLHGINGNFSETEDIELDQVIKRLDAFKKTKKIKKVFSKDFVEVIDLPEKVKLTFTNPTYQRIQTILNRRHISQC